jgi:AraC family transcriptional regulator, transcriptional activator of pobA
VAPGRPKTRLPYRSQVPSLVRTEVQRVDRHHVAVGYGPHAHEFFEMAVFDTAGGLHSVSGQAEEIREGQVWMLPPGTTRDLTAIGEATGWLVLLGPEQLGLADAVDVVQPWLTQPLIVPFQNTDATGRPLPLQLMGRDLARWRGWLRDLETELATRPLGYPQVVEATLNLLLVSAARMTSARTSPRSDPLVSQALEIVDERFRGPLALSDVADAVHVSSGHLTETVRRHTGRPLGEWILQRRMTEARRLLGETQASVADVASRCGFTTVAHFGRQFRRLHGMSPSEWRSSLGR